MILVFVLLFLVLFVSLFVFLVLLFLAFARYRSSDTAIRSIILIVLRTQFLMVLLNIIFSIFVVFNVFIPSCFFLSSQISSGHWTN